MTDAEPGSDRWNWLAEGNAKQARKRVSVKLVLQDNFQKVMVVKPTYKSGWDIPGGMAEPNESPRETGKREVYEELGIVVQIGSLLYLEWVAPHGPWDDLLNLVFDASTVKEEEVRTIELQDGELSTFQFVPISDLEKYLSSRTAGLVRRAIANRGTANHFDEVESPE